MKSKKSNEIDKSLYSEKSLFLLNIRELRDLGRKFGVPSPTTKKKQELVDYILNVVYGKVQTPVRNSYGRPSTREFDISKCLDKIKKKSDISDELKNVSLKDLGTQKLASFQDISEQDEIETKVFFEGDDGYYLRTREFIVSEGDIKVSEEIVKKFNLENLDVIEITRNGDMFKIISINGIKTRTGFEKIEVCGTRLHSGISRDFYLSTKEEVSEKLNKLSTDCENCGIKLLVFSTKKYGEKTTESIIYNLEEGSSKVYKNLIFFIGECEKAIFEGQDFIVAIENADDLDFMLGGFEKDVSERIKKYLQTALPRFASLGNILIMFKCERELDY